MWRIGTVVPLKEYANWHRARTIKMHNTCQEMSSDQYSFGEGQVRIANMVRIRCLILIRINFPFHTINSNDEYIILAGI